MVFKSILYADEDIKAVVTPPAFFQDLQLDYILENIESFVKGYDIKHYFYTLPNSATLINYRQQICKDLSDSNLIESVKKFCRLLHKSTDSHALSLESEGAVQSATYHLQAATLYWQALLSFEEALKSCSLSSDGFTSLHDYITRHIAALRDKGFESALQRANDFFSQMSFQLTIEEDRITITEEETSPNDSLNSLATTLGEYGDASEACLNDIFPNALEPSYLEGTLIHILKKSNPDIFKEIRLFHNSYTQFYDHLLIEFCNEVQFYLGFLEFKSRTESMGYTLCIPTICTSFDENITVFNGAGVFDIALVWKHTHSNYTVVTNDFKWTTSPSFFVVTGPNQGGKTTFARSMGQAVYFSMMGLCANATNITVPMFNGISTHFEAEELLQSNSGKLKEELNRLKPMMQQDKTHQFVILNELFTTATTHDALIMGKKVMEHFLQRNCYGIYVTHIQELAEESDSIISLVAQVEEGEDKKRTYRIIPMKAQGYGYSDSLVKQFNLSYEDIIRRLS